MFSCRYVAAALPALFTLLFTPLSAQEPASPVPAFHATTLLVVLDVVVTDRFGKPIRGLTRDDFSLTEDGVTQNIASFESTPDFRHGKVILTSGRTDTQGAGVSPRPLNIIVLDELNSDSIEQAYARVCIEKFLTKHGPRLPVATSLMLLGQKQLELLHDYTQDAGALMTTLHARQAELPFGFFPADRLLHTLWALEQISAANSHFAGRKNVIWVGPGFPSLNTNAAFDLATRQELLKVISQDADLLLRARVSVYTVDPRGLEVSPVMYGSLAGGNFMTGTGDQATGDLLFENIASETGGEIFRLRNDVDVAIAESVEDGSASYSLSYYPTNHDWNGKYRHIHVSVRGNGLRSRARKGYFAIATTPLTDQQIDGVLSGAVINPLPYRALNIQANVQSAGQGSARFNIRVERSGLDCEALPDGKRRCEVTVVVASLGEHNKVFEHKVTELESLVDGKRFAEQSQKQENFELIADLPPKTSHVRIVVRDARSDHIGTVDLDRSSLPLH